MFLFWKYFTSTDNYYKLPEPNNLSEIKQIDHIQSTNKHLKKSITILIREFYDFENDLQHSIDSIINLIPNVQIYIIYNVEPYPPMSFMANYSTLYSNIKFINLNFDVKKSSKNLSPIFSIKTKYTLFIPDSIRLGGRSILQKMLKEIENTTGLLNGIKKSNTNANKIINRKIVVTSFSSNQKTAGNCCAIKNDIVNWTMEFTVKNDTKHCDMVRFFYTYTYAYMF